MRIEAIVRVVVFAALWSGVLLAQSEESLRRFFEGKEVVVKMDMPGDVSGIDVFPEEEIPVNYRKVGDGIRRYGVSIRKGDTVMVTLLKVKKKLIEFQLGGGGFGTFGDMSGGPSVPSTYVGKSNREKDLEDQRRSAKDDASKRRIESELDHLRRERQREEALLSAQAAQAEMMKESIERQKRPTSGSRFNVRYRREVPDQALTPQGLMAALRDYVEFSPATAETGRATGTPGLAERPAVRPSAAPTTALKKGMTEAEVTALYGKPKSRTVEEVAGMKVTRCVYDQPDTEITAQFVDGVLTKFSIATK